MARSPTSSAHLTLSCYTVRARPRARWPTPPPPTSSLTTSPFPESLDLCGRLRAARPRRSSPVLPERKKSSIVRCIRTTSFRPRRRTKRAIPRSRPSPADRSTPPAPWARPRRRYPQCKVTFRCPRELSRPARWLHRLAWPPLLRWLVRHRSP